MAGRKPKPTALKLLSGTAQPSRMNKDETAPEAADVKAPEGLSLEAKKCWAIVSKQLQDAKVLSVLDVHALSMYCEVFARWKFANDKLSSEGPVIIAPSGFPVQSPYLQISNKSFDQMKALLVEFGMTPSSRTKVSTVAPEEEDAASAFMKGNKKK